MRKPSYYANVRKVPKYGLENLFRGVPKKRNIELYKIYIFYNSGKLCKHENQKNRLKAVFLVSKIK